MCLIGMVGILSISGQNRHLSTEHDQYKVSGGSSTCYTGLVQQRSHPQGKMHGKSNWKIFHQTVSMILFSIFQLLYIRSLLKMLDFDWVLQFLQLLFPGLPLKFFGLLANMAAVSLITFKYNYSFLRLNFLKPTHLQEVVVYLIDTFALLQV